MEPGSITVLVVQNPDEEATVVARSPGLDPDSTIEEYGEQIKRGAFVALIQRDRLSNTTGGELFVADRIDSTLYLQTNAYMSDDGGASVDDIGPSIAAGYAPLPEPVELNTYTVFGTDDDGERFSNLCTAETAEQAAAQTKTAVLVDEGCEHLVTVDIVLTGDHTDAEAVNV